MNNWDRFIVDFKIIMFFFSAYLENFLVLV